MFGYVVVCTRACKSVCVSVIACVQKYVRVHVPVRECVYMHVPEVIHVCACYAEVCAGVCVEKQVYI